LTRAGIYWVICTRIRALPGQLQSQSRGGCKDTDAGSIGRNHQPMSLVSISLSRLFGLKSPSIDLIAGDSRYRGKSISFQPRPFHIE
jgi:hypothetical protein